MNHHRRKTMPTAQEQFERLEQAMKEFIEAVVKELTPLCEEVVDIMSRFEPKE